MLFLKAHFCAQCREGSNFNFWHGDIQLPQQHLLKTIILYPLDCLHNTCWNQLIILLTIYFWTLSSIPLINTSTILCQYHTVLIHSAPGDVFKFRYIKSLSAWRSQGLGIFLERFTLSPPCIPLSLPTAAQTLPRCSGNTRLYWVRGHGYLLNGGFWMRCSKSVWWWTHLLGDWRIINVAVEL